MQQSYQDPKCSSAAGQFQKCSNTNPEDWYCQKVFNWSVGGKAQKIPNKVLDNWRVTEQFRRNIEIKWVKFGC